jgi:microcystin-dependent protein
MSSPYIGEIRMFAGNFAPVGWALCNGQQLPISENDALFTLLGTTYGGDGQETFNLPDLRSRIPVHQGTGSGLTPRVLAEAAGTEQVSLSVQQIPLHNHGVGCQTAGGDSRVPTNALPAMETGNTAATYAETDTTVNMKNTLIAPTGGSQPHENMQPFLVINYIISLFGRFPSPT